MSAATDPGRLRHRLTIEMPEGVPDGAGGVTSSWSELATVWGVVEPLKAAEAAAGGRLASVATHRVLIRHRDDVGGGMRVRHRDRMLRVLAVHDPEERGRYLELLTKEET